MRLHTHTAAAWVLAALGTLVTGCNRLDPPGTTMPPAAQSPSLFHLVRAPAAAQRPAPVLLLLHGVGSNERDLMGLAPSFDPRFLVLSLRAPNQLGQGAYGWFRFDLRPDGTRNIDLAQAEASRLLLLAFLDALPSTHPEGDATNVYLAGFSQGSIMAASVMLSAPKRLKGIVMMSGRILPEALAARVPDAALAGFPVLVVHGTHDTVLPVANGRASRDALLGLGPDVTYHEYDMAHEVTRESLAVVTTWLTQRLDAAR